MHDRLVSHHDTTPPCDWRGTPIAAGQPVLYAMALGTNPVMVEARTRAADEGPLYTDYGRVWVAVERRSAGGGVAGARLWVHVAPERLTVLGGALPHSDHPTEAERVVADRALMQQRQETERTHTITGGARANRSFARWCKVCGTKNARLAEISCEDAIDQRTQHDNAIADMALADTFSPEQLTRMGLTA